MTKINWEEHVTAFRASSQTLAAYCTATGIKPDTFRYHLYKAKSKQHRPRRFQEFQIATELVITRDPRGSLTLSGFDVAHLPQIVSAWSNALS
jgi:hypothetical protein